MQKTWKKKDNCTLLTEVLERNTGIPVNELINPPSDYYIQNMMEAADMIMGGIRAGRHFVIYGDYDCDGITSSSILYLLMKSLGVEPDVILPKRFSEGYGLNMKRAQELPEGCFLITIDNGVAAVDQIRAAKDRGCTVVVIDHHLRREDGILPDADLIVDPNALDGSDFNGYCAAGLAYKLACTMSHDWELLQKLLPLAAIGTVADVMRLLYDNRNIVIGGLRNLNSGVAPLGLRVLCSVFDLSYVTEGDFGFRFGPVMNASGRLHDNGAEEVFRLLTTDDPEYAKQLAQQLVDVNEQRKHIVFEGDQTCELLMSEGGLYGNAPIVVYSTKDCPYGLLHEGVVGIHAGHLAETYRVPAIVLTETEPGILKGSARSIPQVHLKNLLDTCKDLMLGYGGHAGAAGLRVAVNQVETFRAKLQEEYKKLNIPDVNLDVGEYDLEVPLRLIVPAIKKVERYGPYGEGNPQIVFKVPDVVLTPRQGQFYKAMGATGTSIKLFCQDVDIMGFGMLEEFRNAGEPTTLNLYGCLSFNRFAGKETPQVELIGFENAALKNTTRLSAMLKERFRNFGGG